jgi:hypothetical protein
MLFSAKIVRKFFSMRMVRLQHILSKKR